MKLEDAKVGDKFKICGFGGDRHFIRIESFPIDIEGSPYNAHIIEEANEVDEEMMFWDFKCFGSRWRELEITLIK